MHNQDFIKKGLDLIGAQSNTMDVCTHRVIHALKKNCNQLNSEEVSKLAVMMLNCQLEIEGRPIFPCKPEMVKLKKISSKSLRYYEIHIILEPFTMHIRNEQ